jgi:hypothetical protein
LVMLAMVIPIVVEGRAQGILRFTSSKKFSSMVT